MDKEIEIPEGYYLDNSEVLTPNGIIKNNELKKLPNTLENGDNNIRF